ncbi:KxYKxGKxW signal peptide domain-containing protein [Lactobacillaceae bacterium Scapto_B20]
MNLNKNPAKLHYKMYKSGKKWIIASVVTLAVGISISNIFNEQTVNADSQSVTTGHNQSQSSATTSSSASSSAQSSSSDVLSATVALSVSSVSVSASTTSSTAITSDRSSANSASFYATSSDEKLMNSAVFNQNFHYNVPRGYSNDVQSILPHTNKNGQTDYYDVYYLYNPNPSQISFGDEWYHVKTTDFKTFTPLDSQNPTSVKNVAIPDPDFKAANGKSGSQIASNNKNGIPWDYVATGSVIYNNGLLTKDQWGNKIDHDAQLAYFTSFINNQQKSYLAYSNNDQQFHPYSNKPILPSSLSEGRDFFVQRVKNKLVGYLAGGFNSKVYVTTSNDGVNWHYDSSNDINLGNELGSKLQTESETPIIKTVNGHPFMFYSWHYNDYRGNAAISGRINKQGIFQLDRNSKMYTLDGSAYKGDTYAGNYTNLDNQTLINVNWSGNWGYSGLYNQYSFTRHSGTMALPRLIQYRNGKFVFTPVEPNNKLIVSYKVDQNSNNSPLMINTNNKLDFSFDNPADEKTLNLSRANSTISITIGNGKLRLIRNNSLNDNLQKDVSIPINTSNINKLQMYVDNSSIELYLPEIGQSYNIVNFSKSQNEPYRLVVNAKATIKNYEFNSKYPALTSKRLKSSIKNLSQSISNDNQAVKMISSHVKANGSKSSSEYTRSIRKMLRSANTAQSTASSYVAKADGIASDARSSLYLTLASSAYNDATTAEANANNTIIKAKNQLADKKTKFVQTLNGVKTVNGAKELFINGKQVIDQLVTDDHGNQSYYDSNGRAITNSFYTNNGKYYYFNNDGNMVKNQFIESFPGTNQFYYFSNDGSAVSGKHSIGDNNYRFDTNGIQLKNALVVNNDGTLSYYEPNSGLEANNETTTIFGTSFNFNSNGVLDAKNQFVVSPSEDNVIYYLNDTGHITTGAKDINGFSYYFSSDGEEYINQFLSDSNNNVLHYFDNSGHMVKNQYVASTNDAASFYYFDANGNAVKGPQTVNGIKQLFDSSGVQLKAKTYVNNDDTLSYYDSGSGNLVTKPLTINNQTYNFNSDGKLIAPNSFVKFPTDNNITYYLDSNNQVAKGLKTINGNQYYFDSNGRMLINGSANDSNGNEVVTDSNGIVIKS